MKKGEIFPHSIQLGFQIHNMALSHKIEDRTCLVGFSTIYLLHVTYYPLLLISTQQHFAREWKLNYLS